jgi:hypothetical protein
MELKGYRRDWEVLHEDPYGKSARYRHEPRYEDNNKIHLKEGRERV